MSKKVIEKQLGMMKMLAEAQLDALKNGNTKVFRAEDIAELASTVIYLINDLKEPAGDELDDYEKIAPGLYVDADDETITFRSVKPGVLDVKVNEVVVPRQFLLEYLVTNVALEMAKRDGSLHKT